MCTSAGLELRRGCHTENGLDTSCDGAYGRAVPRAMFEVLMGKVAGSQVMRVMHVMMQVARPLWQMQQACCKSADTSSSRAKKGTHRTNIYQVS